MQKKGYSRMGEKQCLGHIWGQYRRWGTKNYWRTLWLTVLHPFSKLLWLKNNNWVEPSWEIQEETLPETTETQAGIGLGSSFLSVLIVFKNNGGQAHVFLRAVLGSQAAGFTLSSFPPNLLFRQTSLRDKMVSLPSVWVRKLLQGQFD